MIREKKALEKAKSEAEKQTKRIITFPRMVMILFVCVLLVYVGIHKRLEQKIDITEGIQAVKNLEQRDTKELEAKIQALEEAAPENQPLNVRFANSVILGDSITQGLIEYEILDPSIVIADIGVRLTGVEEELTKAEGLNPKYVFLCYGENDIKATRGNTTIFKQRYQVVIERLKKSLPKAKLYVNSILPVQKKQIDLDPRYASLPEYNQILQELCTEEHIVFIDNTNLTKDEFYESDGMHQTIHYYPIWVAHMAEVAGI